MSIAAGDLRMIDSAEGDCPSADAGSARGDSRMDQTLESCIDGDRGLLCYITMRRMVADGGGASDVSS